MNRLDQSPNSPLDLALMSEHERLLLLDLAAEVIEGLDQLGTTTRDEVEALMERLERSIGDEDPA